MKQAILALLLTTTLQAQDSFWPKEQILLDGAQYELKSAGGERVVICRVHRYLGGHMYEVDLPKEWKWGGSGGIARGTRQGEPVYLYSNDQKKRIVLNISAWASIRELHVDSRILKEKSVAASSKKTTFDEISENFGPQSWKP